MKPGRNDPCPCGSGKKYKNCCQGKAESRAAAPSPLELNQLVALFNGGRIAEVEMRARLLAERYPESGEAWKLLGTSLGVQGKNALHALKRATELLPGDAMAHNNLGNALKDLGQFDGAVASYGRALELKPNFVEARSNLGNSQMALGQVDAAVACYRRALKAKPDYADAHYNLGNALKGLGQPDAAAASYRQALKFNPNDAMAHNNLGVVLKDLGQADAAVASYRRALELKPAYAEAHNNLGNALKDLGQFDDAVASYRRALEFKPDYAEAFSNLGLVLKELGQLEDAETSCRRALEISPGFAEAHNNLGNVLKELGQFDAAVASYLRALDIRPDFALAHANAGQALFDLAEDGMALEHLEAALALEPNMADAHFGIAALLLRNGAFGRGWKEYEWRIQYALGASYAPDPCKPGTTLPRPSSYLPVDLAGKRLFIIADQGIGDELFFLRFAPELKRRGAWLAYRAMPKPRDLIARNGVVDQMLAPDECPPDIDHTFLVSEMPLVLGMQDSDPLPPPFKLVPLPDRVARMRDRLAAIGEGPFLGVTWRAGTLAKGGFKKGLSKEAPLDELARSLRAWPGQVLVLQRNPAPGEIKAFGEALGRPAHDFSAANEDLEEALALLSLLDEYVGVSNTNMHLSAGLGKPCHVLVDHPPDWRWMAQGEESPWFPGFPVYRQARDKNWGEALARLAQDLTLKYQ